MLRKMVVGVLTVCALQIGSMSPAVASGPVDGLGRSASKVAKQVHCKHLRHRSGAGPMAFSGVVCDLKGKRVNVITFKSKRQQKTWLGLVYLAFPGGTHYCGVGRGVVVIAKNGNRPAARVGARALRGFVYSF